jgi:hypothetical protein
MEDKTGKIVVTLLTADDFLRKYPRFKTFIEGKGEGLFKAIMQPDVVIEAMVLANYGYPSVLAVAKQSEEILTNPEQAGDNNFAKQFVGSVICAVMEANGYEKSGTKKSVPHKFFNVGEIYERNTTISRVDSVQRCGTERLANLTPVDRSYAVSWSSSK